MSPAAVLCSNLACVAVLTPSLSVSPQLPARKSEKLDAEMDAYFGKAEDGAAATEGDADEAGADEEAAGEEAGAAAGDDAAEA